MDNFLNKKIMWISIYHPGEIISAVGMSLLARDKYKINLLIKDHPYWKRIGVDFYKKYFDNVYHFPDIGFSKHFLRETLKILQTKKVLKKLNIKSDDLYLTFSDNIFLSIYKKHFIHKFSSRTECTDSLDEYKRKHPAYREILTSKIWNLTIVPFFNLLPIVYLQHQNDCSLYEIVYKKGDLAIFNKFLYFRGYDEGDLKEDEIYNFLPFIKNRLTTGRDGTKNNTIIFLL